MGDPDKKDFYALELQKPNSLGFFGLLEKYMDQTFREINGKDLGTIQSELGISNISLSKMFLAIQETFQEQIRHISNKVENNNPYCIVLGHTGAGKSTLIGYLLGLGLQKKEISHRYSGKVVLEYADNSSFEDRPEIGHVLSQTKGCRIYNNYIDVGSFDDTGGREPCICNCLSMKIAVEKYIPKKTILVIEPGNILDNYGCIFVKFIEKISNSMTKDEILEPNFVEDFWSQTLLVINDKRGKISEEDILDEISRIFEITKKLRNELIYDDRFDILRESISWSGDEMTIQASKALRSLGPSDIFRHQRTMEMISPFLSEGGEKIITVVNFETDKSRLTIEKWLGGQALFKQYDIRAENFIYGSREKFISILKLARDYFEIIKGREDKKIFVEHYADFSNLINKIYDIV